MRLTGHLRIGIAVVLTGWIVPTRPAQKLTEFNGMWRGIGTDLSSPFDKQGTNCQNTIQAHPSNLSSHMTCDGQAGLHKVITLEAWLNGDQFSGTLTQKTGGKASTLCPPVLKSSSLSGRRVEDTASFQVQFPDPKCSNATVKLEYNKDRRSYHMLVTTSVFFLPFPVMDVDFTRAASP
jgi:hypothetical protein